MDTQEFIKNFANQFEVTDASEITMETSFRDIDEWDSLVALAILNMIAKKYGVKLTFDDMRQTNTVQELFNVVESKK